MPKVTNEKLGERIDELARMIATGFAAVDERFRSLETRLTGKIESVEARLTDKIDNLDLKLSAYATNWQTDFEKLRDQVTLNTTDIEALNKVVYKKN